MRCRECIPRHSKFFTYTSNAAFTKINSRIYMYNSDNNKMQKSNF